MHVNTSTCLHRECCFMDGIVIECEKFCKVSRYNKPHVLSISLLIILFIVVLCMYCCMVAEKCSEIRRIRRRKENAHHVSIQTEMNDTSVCCVVIEPDQSLDLGENSPTF